MLALVGPTAVGKSALAHAIAREIGATIVVADPFQRYRGLEIAADAPSAIEREQVDYRFVGDLGLDQSSTVAEFARSARALIDRRLDVGRTPLVSGGTGLYVQAALCDVAFPPPLDDELVARTERDVDGDPVAARRELGRRDPTAAARIDLANPRRVARALALARSGRAAPDGARLWSASPRHPTRTVMVTRPRDVLDELIARRVRREIDAGLVAELTAALDSPGVRREPLQIIGAREVDALRSGALSATRFEERLCVRTRRLARRQLTWLAKMRIDSEVDLGDRPAHAALARVREALDGVVE